MYDFGFRDLRLVSEYRVPLERARSAVDASSVLAGARQFTELAESLADRSLVIGTTAVGLRRQEHPLYTLAESSGKLLAEAKDPKGRVALLFGSEKTGLSNEELSYCHWLLTIPMHQTEGMRHASMNLGQAVAVCLYELVREAAAPGSHAPAAGALSADLDRLAHLLMQVMEESGYSRRHPANFDETLVRRLVRHMGLDRSHALAWMGILRQVLWKLYSGKGEAPEDSVRDDSL